MSSLLHTHRHAHKHTHALRSMCTCINIHMQVNDCYAISNCVYLRMWISFHVTISKCAISAHVRARGRERDYQSTVLLGHSVRRLRLHVMWLHSTPGIGWGQLWPQQTLPTFPLPSTHAYIHIHLPLPSPSLPLPFFIPSQTRRHTHTHTHFSASWGWRLDEQ